MEAAEFNLACAEEKILDNFHFINKLPWPFSMAILDKEGVILVRRVSTQQVVHQPH